jgi:hypothetical protein
VADVARRMPTLVERRNGVWWVPNPVQAKENFADRWRTHPERARRFFDWMEQVNTDLAGLTSGHGFDRVIEKLAASLGESPVREAAERVGAAMAKDCAAGRLTMASARGCFSACTFTFGDRHVIVYSPLASPARRQSDVAHEAAHILLGHKVKEVQHIGGLSFHLRP